MLAAGGYVENDLDAAFARLELISVHLIMMRQPLASARRRCDVPVSAAG